MTQVLPTEPRQPDFSHYRAQGESAMLAQTVAETASLEPQERKQLLRSWLSGVYNGASFATDTGRDGIDCLDWMAAVPTRFTGAATASPVRSAAPTSSRTAHGRRL